MSHTESFAAFQARRDAERAQARKVTWRKVSELTGGGYSGLGPAGALAWVKEVSPGYVPYGRVIGSERVQLGWARTLQAAKASAAAILTGGEA